jgi:hypothetical protein
MEKHAADEIRNLISDLKKFPSSIQMQPEKLLEYVGARELFEKGLKNAWDDKSCAVALLLGFLSDLNLQSVTDGDVRKISLISDAIASIDDYATSNERSELQIRRYYTALDWRTQLQSEKTVIEIFERKK